jgi:hypothetical protein
LIPKIKTDLQSQQPVPLKQNKLKALDSLFAEKQETFFKELKQKMNLVFEENINFIDNSDNISEEDLVSLYIKLKDIPTTIHGVLWSCFDKSEADEKALFYELILSEGQRVELFKTIPTAHAESLSQKIELLILGKFNDNQFKFNNYRIEVKNIDT